MSALAELLHQETALPTTQPIPGPTVVVTVVAGTDQNDHDDEKD